ncbi:Hemicentin-1 [Trichinella murrelli]|uniref:Hemicentin-1 n=1 Tax=Trichinella murrelli TaxID=144512 RepID=A0A0V0U8D7_9BILA|nr:Hemicentin-1 [Trichinella murrelli]
MLNFALYTLLQLLKLSADAAQLEFGTFKAAVYHGATVSQHRSQHHFKMTIPNANFHSRQQQQQQQQQQNNQEGMSSLTFVIDTTGSMYDDLQQVREGYERIFETVAEQKDRLIYNYVLVPFHDPEVKSPIVTQDGNYLRKQLDAIDVQGGGDCPEMTLTGIKLALQSSLPASFIYVFTDARAKDYHLLDELVALVQEKQSQIVFVMTGDCGDRTHPGYVAFEKLASISSGQIFHLDKADVNKIIEYVRVSLQTRAVRIVAEDKEESGNFEIQFPADSHLFEMVVSVSGERPQIKLIDPEGQVVKGRNVVQLSNVIVEAVTKPKPGIWTLKGSSFGRRSVRVTGKSNLDFKHGFSPFPDSYHSKLHNQPISGQSTHLIVNVTGLPRPGVTTDAEFINLRGEAIFNGRLHAHSTQFGVYYLDAFTPPEGHFYAKIIGVDEHNFKFQRLSPSTVCSRVVRQLPIVLMPKYTEVMLFHSVSLTCAVQSSIPYTVAWYKGNDEHLSGPLYFEHSETITWTIPTVTHSDAGYYKCSVNSQAGNVSGQTYLEIREPPLHVSSPKVYTFPEHTPAYVDCTHDEPSMATITWQRRGEPLHNTDHIRIFPNGTLLINRISKSDEGPYVCNVLTSRGRALADITVLVIQRPRVHVSPRVIDFARNQDFTIRCDVQGQDVVAVQWYFNGRPIVPGQRFNVDSNNQLTVFRAEKQNEGRYECRAENAAGSTSDAANAQLRGLGEMFRIEKTTTKSINVAGNERGSLLDDERRCGCTAAERVAVVLLAIACQTYPGNWTAVFVRNSIFSVGAFALLCFVIVAAKFTTSAESVTFACSQKRRMLSTRITTITINADASFPRITICTFGVVQARVRCASFVQAYSSITLIIARDPVRQVVTSSASFSFPMFTIWLEKQQKNPYIFYIQDNFCELMSGKGRDALVFFGRRNRVHRLGNGYLWTRLQSIINRRREPGRRLDCDCDRQFSFCCIKAQCTRSVCPTAASSSAFAHFVPERDICLAVQLPRIHPPDQNVTVSENETATLECNVHGGYPPARLYWYKEPNEKIEADNDKYIFDGEKLLIKQSEKSDAGNYRCVAENEVGKSVAQRRLFVTPPIRYLWTMCDEHGRAIKTTYVPARGDTPMINSPMLPWDTEVIDFPIINGSNNVFIRCLPSS